MAGERARLSGGPLWAWAWMAASIRGALGSWPDLGSRACPSRQRALILPPQLPSPATMEEAWLPPGLPGRLRSRSSAVKLGSESLEDMKDVLFERLLIRDAHRGLAVQLR